MTQETAEKIRKLLELRDEYQKELNKLSKCTSIEGSISDGVNGMPFSWYDNNYHIAILKRGLEDEIRVINTQIESM